MDATPAGSSTLVIIDRNLGVGGHWGVVVAVDVSNDLYLCSHVSGLILGIVGGTH